MGDLDGPAASPEDEEAASLELAMRLQLEEEAWMAQQQAGMAQQQAMEETADEDEESLALAIRLQQEDDDEQLRLALGVQNDERGSPGSYSYEQLMNLTETVGTVSRGASDESIGALPTVTFKCCDSSVNMGTKVCALAPATWERPLTAADACSRARAVLDLPGGVRGGRRAARAPVQARRARRVYGPVAPCQQVLPHLSGAHAAKAPLRCALLLSCVGRVAGGGAGRRGVKPSADEPNARLAAAV